MANLVILESPYKVPTVKSYLGSGYKVMASVGHVRDLPKSTLGVDIEGGFAAHYINIRGKGDLIKELRKEAKKATKVFLATDPDREGEAISWHLAVALDLPKEKIKRITFNEITKQAVKAAIKTPREIDEGLVNSQQARRILDRIVGYKISPFLWKTIRSGLSAGRVQSVATRAIVEREQEIRSFVPKEYWSIDAIVISKSGEDFTAKFFGNSRGKLEITDGDEAKKITDAIKGKPFLAKSVKKAVRYKNPMPPFTTSTMQQEASKKLNFQSQRIMKVAQELYEGINLGSAAGGTHGLITYMRTDSLRVSDEAQTMAKDYIVSKFGASYYPKSPRVYKSKGNSQDAHEAIRPVDPSIEPDSVKSQLSADQYKLYKLIWSRFIASQMASEALDTVNVSLDCEGYVFHASGSTVRFPGFVTVYDSEDAQDKKSGMIPEITEGDVLSQKEIKPEQHFTEPPSRYTEATLIKFLEENGIGRPSTYTPIITTILSRGYVSRDGKSLKPTELGEVTNDIMINNFPMITDYAFTAEMETKLDDISNGETTMEEVLGFFYKDFKVELEKAEETVDKSSINLKAEETDIICDKCGSRMVIKNGRYGKFAACPNYPTCKSTKPLAKDGSPIVETPPEHTGQTCELCGGEMLKRKGRYGEFIACSNYPKCKNTKQILHEIGVPCPKCGSALVRKNGKGKSNFYGCSAYPKCDFVSWDMPTNEKCPECGEMLFIKKGKKQLVCHNDKCNYKQDMTESENKETIENK
mgnify:CR=1 FL=1